MVYTCVISGSRWDAGRGTYSFLLSVSVLCSPYSNLDRYLSLFDAILYAPAILPVLFASLLKILLLLLQRILRRIIRTYFTRINTYTFSSTIGGVYLVAIGMGILALYIMLFRNTANVFLVVPILYSYSLFIAYPCHRIALLIIN